MLDFNAGWFASATEGISVKISFLEDQATVWKGYSDPHGQCLNQAIAARIIHRIIQNLTDTATADAEMTKGGVLVKAIESSLFPIADAKKVLRWCFNKPADAVILLCVDDLAHLYTKEPPLRWRTNFLWEQLVFELADQSLFLAMAPSASDIAFLRSRGDRLILYQSLDPLPILDVENTPVATYPAVLQPFIKTSPRAKFPRGRADLKLRDDMAALLRATEGNPQRMSVLFTKLHELNTNCSASRTYQSSVLRSWLYEKVDNVSRKDRLCEVTNTTALSFNRLPIKSVEYIAQNAAQTFSYPGSHCHSEKWDLAIPQSADLGLWQMNPCDTYNFNTYIPMSVLDAQNTATLEDMGPSGEALFKLRDAINDLYDSRPNRKLFKRKLQDALLYACLLYVRSNRNFAPREFCNPMFGYGAYGSREGLGVMLCSRTIELWKTQRSELVCTEEVQTLVAKLRLAGDNVSGAIIRSTTNNNVFYGIFKSCRGEGYVLLRFDTKYVYTDGITGSRGSYRKWPRSVTLQDGTVVPILSLSFRSGALPKSGARGDTDRGIITMSDLLRRLPTAAVPLRSILDIKKYFS